jgi:hypothetical protein
VNDPDVWYSDLNHLLPERMQRTPSERAPNRRPLWESQRAETEYQNS